MAINCLVKTYAFISALMSIAVLASSIAVLVSSIACAGGSNGTTSHRDSQQQPDSENNYTTTTPFTPIPLPNNHTDETEQANGTISDDEPLHFPIVTPRNLNMTTHPFLNTTSSNLLNEKEEKKNMSTAQSASMSPAFTLSNSTIIATTTDTPATNISFLRNPHFSNNDNANIANQGNGSSAKTSSLQQKEPESDSEQTTAATAAAETTETATINPSAKLQPSWNAFLEHQHDFWEAKSDTYIILIQASSGTGIFAAVLQLGFSWLLICSSAKDLKDRTTLWNLSNFIVLILTVVIVLIPLSYNSANDTFKGTGVFWREAYRKIKSLEFSSKTLETIWSSISNFLAKDLALYYYVLGVDAFILMVLLIPSLVCCVCAPCKKCCWKNKGKRSGGSKSESDLMLFGGGGTGGGSASGADLY